MSLEAIRLSGNDARWWVGSPVLLALADHAGDDGRVRPNGAGRPG